MMVMLLNSWINLYIYSIVYLIDMETNKQTIHSYINDKEKARNKKNKTSCDVQSYLGLNTKWIQVNSYK